MKSLFQVGLFLVLAANVALAAEVVFEEKNGLVAIEAEHFYKQSQLSLIHI